VALLRGDADARVLMLHRQPAMRSFGGFWVFPGGTVDESERAPARSGDAGAIAAAATAASRELLEEAGLPVPVDALRHFAHWITPSGLERRFDTHFFIAAAPLGLEPHIAGAEASEARWVDPRTWASDVLPEELPLTAPTLIVLREIDTELILLGTVQALLTQSVARRVRTVLPKMLHDGSVALPWDPDYDRLPGEGVSWDAEGIAQRAAWPRRL